MIGFLGDFDLAEEAAQDAFAIAAERWPRDGVPSSPRAWLVTTARNRAIDRVRRDQTLVAKTRLLQLQQKVNDTMDANRPPPPPGSKSEAGVNKTSAGTPASGTTNTGASPRRRGGGE